MFDNLKIKEARKGFKVTLSDDQLINTLTNLIKVRTGIEMNFRDSYDEDDDKLIFYGIYAENELKEEEINKLNEIFNLELNKDNLTSYDFTGLLFNYLFKAKVEDVKIGKSKYDYDVVKPHGSACHHPVLTTFRITEEQLTHLKNLK